MGMDPRTVMAILNRQRGEPPAAKPRAKRFTGDFSTWKAWCCQMENLPGVFIPIKVICEANVRDSHWGSRKRRTEKQREAVALTLGSGGQLSRFKDRVAWPPATFVLTRYSPNTLDPIDNLPSSFKHVRDELADIFGFNDRETAWGWDYRQERTKRGCFGIRILYVASNPRELLTPGRLHA